MRLRTLARWSVGMIGICVWELWRGVLLDENRLRSLGSLTGFGSEELACDSLHKIREVLLYSSFQIIDRIPKFCCCADMIIDVPPINIINNNKQLQVEVTLPVFARQIANYSPFFVNIQHPTNYISKQDPNLS